MTHQPAALLIVGLGGQAHVAASIARALDIPLAGFLDATGTPTGAAEILGLPVLGGLSYLSALHAPSIAVAIGDNRLRHRTAGAILAANPAARLVSLVHPRSIREDLVELGSHVTICTNSLLCTEVRVGDGAIINSGAIVEHECLLGRYCHISPGARLAGRVTIGDFTHVGLGATVIDKLHIGSNVTIGAGAVVLSDLPDHATAVGIPARVIKIAPPPGGDL
jgi:UDP-perosamine 4-acetyltransferase